MSNDAMLAHVDSKVFVLRGIEMGQKGRLGVLVKIRIA